MAFGMLRRKQARSFGRSAGPFGVIAKTLVAVIAAGAIITLCTAGIDHTTVASWGTGLLADAEGLIAANTNGLMGLGAVATILVGMLYLVKSIIK